MTGSDSYRTDFEFLLRSIQGIEWEADPETFRFTSIGENAGRVLGFSPEEWLLEGFWVNHIHPEDRERVVAQCRKAIAEGQHHEFEYRMTGADGRTVWFRDTVFVEIQGSGAVRLRGVLIDISAQKRLESQIRDQSEALLGFIDNTPAVIFSKDLEGRYLLVNRWWETVTGMKRSSIIGKTAYDLFPKPVADALRSNDSRVIEAKCPMQFEETVPLPDGPHDYISIKFPLFDSSGHMYALCGISTDITERKQSEQALRDSEQLLRLLANSAKDAIFRYSNNPVRCEYISPAVADITGYTPEEYYADPELWWNIVHPQDQHLLTTSALMAPSGEPVVLRIIRKDGRVIWTEHRNVAVYDDSGEVVAIEGIVRDITERMALEARLNQAQKMEAIGRLAGGVAHDFNNMLTVVLSHSALALQKLQAEDPLRQHIEGIKRAGERAALLTRQLTALSRRQFRVPAILDPNTVVEEMKGMLTRLIGEHIEFVAQLSPDVGHIKADLSQIEQVILNLVINARDAMSAGGKLTIETYPDGPYAALSVSDTGTGIDAVTLEHVFEPFFTTKPEGTGLGLATVYGIVTQSGGDVTVETEVGAGTTFRVLLPRTHAAVTKTETPKVKPVKDSPNETVLLVEDDDQVRNVTAQALETEGYRVLKAKTSAEALRIYGNSGVPIDLLVTDLVLTDMDGVELAAQISAMKRRTAVLFMSGYSDRELTRLGNLDLNRAFIRKPFHPKALMEKMRQLLDSLDA